MILQSSKINSFRKFIAESFKRKTWRLTFSKVIISDTKIKSTKQFMRTLITTKMICGDPFVTSSWYWQNTGRDY